MKILSASGFEHKVIITETLALRMIGSDNRLANICLYIFCYPLLLCPEFSVGCKQVACSCVYELPYMSDEDVVQSAKNSKDFFFYLTSCSIGERRVWYKFA